MMRMKYILRASIAMVAVLFLSCVNTEDPMHNATVRLKLTGGIAVNQPADDITRAASDESLTVESLRVLIFNNSALVSNKLFESGFSFDNSGDNWIVSMDGDAYVDARYGVNAVYVVLNEDTGGLTSSLEGITTQQEMEDLRKGTVAYTELIPVDNNNEPPFLMCVYDNNVNITATKTELDLTGLGDPTYGFPMRRTMAKVVLETIYGGVSTDGKILGTEIVYDPNSATDQTGTGDKVTLDKNGIPTVESTGNKELAGTSEVFVSKLEILNVPTEYSWAQEKDNSQNNVTSSASSFLPPQDISTAYVLPENPIPSQNYMQRVWNGSIVASGSIDFSRTDSFPSFYRTHATSGGSNAYQLEEAYIYSSEPSSSQLATSFNSGNFFDFVQEDIYGPESEIIEGIVTPKFETLNLTSSIDPSAWSVAFVEGKNQYYIPENIQTASSNRTMLRVYLSIGKVMVDVDPEKIKQIIDDALSSENLPIIKEDGEQIIITKGNLNTVVTGMAQAIQNPTTVGDGLGSKGQNIGTSYDSAWGICYTGINAIWSGNYSGITNQEGYYFVDVTSNQTNYYIDIPLYNNDKPDDHNIYRGHEYRVKLYVTKKSSANWTPVAETNRSVSYHELPMMTTRGGESDLCIAAEITTIPTK